jgi:hypothetical protein
MRFLFAIDSNRGYLGKKAPCMFPLDTILFMDPSFNFTEWAVNETSYYESGGYYIMELRPTSGWISHREFVSDDEANALIQRGWFELDPILQGLVALEDIGA